MHGGMWGVCGMYVDRYTYIYICMNAYIHVCMKVGIVRREFGKNGFRWVCMSTCRHVCM